MNNQNQISIKLFAGLLFTSDIKMRMNNSNHWKQSIILPNREENALVEIHHKGNNYIGLYLLHERATLREIEEISELIRRKMILYDSLFNIDQNKICLFAQTFIS